MAKQAMAKSAMKAMKAKQVKSNIKAKQAKQATQTMKAKPMAMKAKQDKPMAMKAKQAEPKKKAKQAKTSGADDDDDQVLCMRVPVKQCVDHIWIRTRIGPTKYM